MHISSSGPCLFDHVVPTCSFLCVGGALCVPARAGRAWPLLRSLLPQPTSPQRLSDYVVPACCVFLLSMLLLNTLLLCVGGALCVPAGAGRAWPLLRCHIPQPTSPQDATRWLSARSLTHRAEQSTHYTIFTATSSDHIAPACFVCFCQPHL
jgi:hypothetical protein